MRFVDEALITIRSGKGGHGCISFRREKFVPRGGPDGGDGGRGGAVIFRATEQHLTLQDFRFQRRFEAENGQPGQGKQMTGRDGRDSLVEVPVGTLVFEHLPEGDRLLADLDAPGKEFVAVQGGRGGKGNLHFKSSTMRAPRFAQPGEPWTEMDVRLELKILADAGIIGLPNAGKSTLISTLSAARPKIAPYPFTTLSPNLGVMENDYNVRMVLADIPGLIEGAHEGHGLGHRFLKHVERTRFLVHVCSIDDLGQDDPWSGFALVDEELARFDPVLARKPQIKAVNKIDLRSPADVDTLKARARDDGIEVFFISALQGDGVDELAAAMWRSLAESAPEENPKVGNNV